MARYNGPGNGDDTASALAIDKAGNIYVTGSSQGVGTNSDYTTIKYDSTGKQQWVARYNGPGRSYEPGSSYDDAYAMAVDAAGNIYVTGESGGEYGLGYATIKYNASGQQQWVARHESELARAGALAVDAAGNVYVTGFELSPSGDYAYLTIKYDANGVELWRNSPTDGTVTALAVDAAGSVYVTGYDEEGLWWTTIKYSPVGPQLSAWNRTTTLPRPSAAAGLTGKPLPLVGGYAYQLGGQNATSPSLTDVYYSKIKTDGSLGLWSPTTPLPKPYRDQVVVSRGLNLYLITGASDVYYAPIRWDGSVGQWIATEPLAPSRQNFAAAVSRNRDLLYVSGGNSGGTTSSSVQFTTVNSDGSLNPWQETTPLPVPMEGHTMVASGYLYVIAPSGMVYYKGGGGDWIATTPLPGAMSGYTAFEANGYLYVVGGNLNAAYYAKIEERGALGNWQPTTALPLTRLGAWAGAYNNVVYLLGGYDGSSSYPYKGGVFYSRLK